MDILKKNTRVCAWGFPQSLHFCLGILLQKKIVYFLLSAFDSRCGVQKKKKQMANSFFFLFPATFLFHPLPPPVLPLTTRTLRLPSLTAEHPCYTAWSTQKDVAHFSILIYLLAVERVRVCRKQKKQYSDSTFTHSHTRTHTLCYIHLFVIMRALSPQNKHTRAMLR